MKWPTLIAAAMLAVALLSTTAAEARWEWQRVKVCNGRQCNYQMQRVWVAEPMFRARPAAVAASAVSVTVGNGLAAKRAWVFAPRYRAGRIVRVTY